MLENKVLKSELFDCKWQRHQHIVTQVQVYWAINSIIYIKLNKMLKNNKKNSENKMLINYTIYLHYFFTLKLDVSIIFIRIRLYSYFLL